MSAVSDNCPGAVLNCTSADTVSSCVVVHQPPQDRQNQVAGFAHLQRLRCVDDVGGGESEMQPARGWTDELGDRGGEGDDVVLSDLFDLFDAIDAEGGA